MSKTTALLAALLTVCCCMAAASQVPVQQLSSLTWLAGCWGSSDAAKNMTMSEQWMRPEGGMMLGMGRTVKNSKAVDWEYIRIEQRSNELYFVVRPRGNSEETTFKAIKLSSREVVFENAEHDFPQRVIYRLTLSGVLAARIEGVENGKPNGIDFPMNRESCPR